MRNGMQWPIGIISSIIFIVIACAVTVYIALLQPVKEDQEMMLDYHALDANANDVIVAGIIFNKKYNLTYTGEGVSVNGSTLSYRLEDMDGNPINNATFEVVIARPIVTTENVSLNNPRIEDGNYIFDNVKVSEKGRWNILAKVTVGGDYRHMNLKSDTMDKSVYEYGLGKPMRNYGANGGRTVL